jgi:hypothetical protein
MENKVESNSEKRKKAYEPPAFRRVRLEIKTSVLAVCSLSFPVSPDTFTCKEPFNSCIDPS